MPGERPVLLRVRGVGRRYAGVTALAGIDADVRGGEVLAIVGEAAGILGPSVGAERRYDGPLGKSDRALLFGAIGLWAGLAPLPDWLGWAMPAMAILAAIGIVNRVRRALAQAEGRA